MGNANGFLELIISVIYLRTRSHSDIAAREELYAFKKYRMVGMFVSKRIYIYKC